MGVDALPWRDAWHDALYAAGRGFYVTRGVCCVALVYTLLQLAFYPIALTLLVVSKASGFCRDSVGVIGAGLPAITPDRVST